MIVRAGSLEFEKTQLSEITLQVRDETLVSQTAAMARKLLQQTHTRGEDFEIQVPRELLRQAEAEKRIWILVLGSIAGISLLVGGIGIMNIMLATVTNEPAKSASGEPWGPGTGYHAAVSRRNGTPLVAGRRDWSSAGDRYPVGSHLARGDQDRYQSRRDPVGLRDLGGNRCGVRNLPGPPGRHDGSDRSPAAPVIGLAERRAFPVPLL